MVTLNDHIPAYAWCLCFEIHCPSEKKQFGDHHVPPMAPAQRGKDKRVQVETYVSSKSRDINALALHHIHHEAI